MVETVRYNTIISLELNGAATALNSLKYSYQQRIWFYLKLTGCFQTLQIANTTYL